MTELVEAAINSALLNKLKTFAQANSLSVSYPNLKFDPPKSVKGGMWLRVSFIPAQTVELSANYGGTNQHQGFMQVDIMLTQDGGERPAQRMAASLIEHFTRGTKMVSSDFIVEIVRPPFRNSSLKDDPWIFVPVRIPYNVYAT